MAVFVSSLFMSAGTFSRSHIFTLILSERMQVMRDVAAYKVRHHLPVEDSVREQKVMSLARQNAQEAGLDPLSVEPFIRELIHAGKTIQHRYLAEWLPVPHLRITNRDLDSIRQRINELDKHLLLTINKTLLTGAFSYSDRALLAEKTVAPNLTETEKDSLMDSLRFIKRAS